MKSLAALLLLVHIGSLAHADAGLDQLKQSFASQIQSSTQIFDRAAAMKPILVPLGTQITKQDCETLKTKIAATYKINPFEFAYETGASYNYMCGGRWGWEKTFVQNKSGNNAFGLPYTMVLQVESKDSNAYRSEFALYFVDANYRIVETQGQSVVQQTKKMVSYGITSVDQAGNVYESVYDQDYGITGGIAQDVRGEHRMERFVAGDGSSTYPMLRNSIRNKTDPSKDYQILGWNRADQKDWQDFQMPITLSTSGGYYNYGGKYHSTYNKPNFKSSLTVKYRGGKEFCAFGDVKADQTWTMAPVDQTTYYKCVNY